MNQHFVVLKFGGTSVSSLERWQVIADQVRQRSVEGKRPVVVCSAIRGVSDELVAIVQHAPSGKHVDALARVEALHAGLAQELGVDLEALLRADLDDLGRLALGAQLIGEVSPRLHARILAYGELMLTRLGTAWLQSVGVRATRVDARDCLRATDEGGNTEHRRYLSASVSHGQDDELRARLGSLDADVIVTQGFIARNRAGESVLLGRGGSDTSAACFAAVLAADACEIWTDVPGMFTANPRAIPMARLLRTLDYDEAQEIASSGARVLHPAAIAPVREANIPLSIRCTPHPGMDGTTIGGTGAVGGPQVKAISARLGITLISMDTVGMWQQIGFLADVFQHFKHHGLSIDLVSTSETNVTVSLDPSANGLDSDTVDALLRDLGTTCRARAIGPCASISLVGQGIRAILHKLGPALELFEEQPIHLVSQAASDLNLTLVTDEEQADRLVRELHHLLFRERRKDATLGPSWEELFDAGDSRPTARAPVWWRTKSDALLTLADRSPLYVYDGETLDERARSLVAVPGVDRAFYAMKANDHEGVLRRITSHSIGLECVSLGEIDHALAVVPGLEPASILFTPNFAGRREYEQGFARGVHMTLDSLYPLQHWPEVFRGRSVLIRMDPGRGRGHHAHVRTAGSSSKFGVSASRLDDLVALAEAAGARVTGLHAHAGSGIRTHENWSENALFLAGVAQRFADVRVLDLGGGFGVPERPGDDPLDLEAVGASILRFKRAHPQFEIWVEPGRFLVAESGVLLTSVTQVKSKGEVRYVGVNAGMNALIRPALYGAWHEIANLSRLDQPLQPPVNVVGPICESGDTLGYDRRLPLTREGDVLLVATAGAYGRVMSSDYNRRARPTEVVLD